jgi:hypothetical protein
MKWGKTACHNELVIDDFQERDFLKTDFSSWEEKPDEKSDAW